MPHRLTRRGIERIYGMSRRYHREHLARHGVILPSLGNAPRYTRDALTLVYLAQGYPRTRPVSKRELTQFIRSFYPETNDVQQARHLGAQKGWFIAAGGRDNRDVDLARGQYQLVSLEKPYPAFHGHRVAEAEGWEDLKAAYDYRCATCGSREGEYHLHWPNTRTRLQMGHKVHVEDLSPAISFLNVKNVTEPIEITGFMMKEAG